jgi:branched-chain amino acid transport system ATP-binding protein
VPQNSLLKVDNLHVHYGKSEIIKGISFHIEEGEVVSLIGANGAGKTTILRTITGFKMPTSGRIWLNDKTLEGIAPHEIAKMGISHVLEGRRVFPELTVEDNLKTGGYLTKSRGDIKQRQEEILKFFPRLRERFKQKAGTLSGGEQQMLVVARAIVGRPSLLLMDEPSAGLAPLMVQEIGRLIKLINQREISIFLVEQNSYLAFNTSSRSYVLESGLLALEGKSQELIKDERVRKAYLSA